MEVLYGIYGNVSAVRVGDFKLIQGENYVPFSPRPMAKNEMKHLVRPYTIWDSELECASYPDAIGCWPDIAPCLFNVRFDPCEKNNVAYFMPQTVEALAYSLKKYQDGDIYRSRRDVSEQLQVDSENYRQILKRLRRSKDTLDVEKIKKWWEFLVVLFVSKNRRSRMSV